MITIFNSKENKMGVLSFLPCGKFTQWGLIGLIVLGIGIKFWHMSYTIDKLEAELVAQAELHKAEVVELQKEVAYANVVAETEKANALKLQLGIEKANNMVSTLTAEKDKIIKDFEKYKKTKPLIVERIVTKINTGATATLSDYQNFNRQLATLKYKDLR